MTEEFVREAKAAKPEHCSAKEQELQKSQQMKVSRESTRQTIQYQRLNLIFADDALHRY